MEDDYIETPEEREAWEALEKKMEELKRLNKDELKEYIDGQRKET